MPRSEPHIRHGQAARREALVFVFSGQGPEWWGMGRELYANEPVFAEAIHTCDEALKAHSAMSITREFLATESESRLGDVEVLQPVLFSVHVGLVSLLRSWGVVPGAVVGHSFGELSAAWAGGAVKLSDAMRIHVVRSRLMKRLAGQGRMVVIETNAEHAQSAIAGLKDRVTVGVVNSPKSVVLSGEDAALDETLARLARAGVAQRPIHMPYAVHSPAMRALLPEVVQALANLDWQPPSIPLFSTVTAGEVSSLDAVHWARNIGEPAHFAGAIDAILDRGATTFVEIGPHPVLGMVMAECASHREKECTILPSLKRRSKERESLLATLQMLAKLGYAVEHANGATGDRQPALPTVTAVTAAASVVPPNLQQLHTLYGPARHEFLVEYLRARVSGRLGTGHISATTPLRELGLDSATAVQLVNELHAELGRRLPATLFFEYPTLDAVARFLASTLGLLPPEKGSSVPTPSPQSAQEPIAIVGIGCRFAGGAHGPDALWQLLEDEVDAVTEVPPSRWDVERSFSSNVDASGKTYSKWAGFLGDIDRFDASFFGIAPREAQSMDPQQRLLLEVSWEALEHTGIAPGSLTSSRTGVFIGICTNDYGGRLLHGDPCDIDAYTFTGSSASVAAGRISYVLGLQGPALSVDTACSSSLVALHLACRSLQKGECDLALAGGVNLILSPALMIYFSRLRALSPTGRSRAFDASADGYVRGEGCGIVVLKRLSEAQAAGDRIYAIVRGSAVNQDGRSNGLTAPSGHAQQEVVRAALADARIAPSQVGYVEAHGTGTPLGDPIELRALGAVLTEGRAAEDKVLVGSIKTNCGHTEGAAGIASVIKVALALHHKRIPRSLHFQIPSPHIPWSELPLRVATTATDWNSEKRRTAGVSSFGFSGTNAHVILQEAEEEPVRGTVPPAVPIPVLLSARSESALRQQLDSLQDFVQSREDVTPVDIACTLATARTHFEHRAGVLVHDRDELLSALAGRLLVAGEVRTGGLALLFTGQGSQRPRMGASLYARYPAFRDALDEVLASLDSQMERPISPVLLADADPALDETGFTQPALFALQVALFHLVASWGLTPGWLVGHSVGELAAAHVGGVLGLKDACTLVAARGRLMQSLPRGGTMVALEATEEEVRPLLFTGEVDLAAINGPRAVVISGDERAVAHVEGVLVSRGRWAQRLRVSHAFHSPRMDAMLGEFSHVAEALSFMPPRIPIVSTVSGRLASADELCTPEYWVRQARATVRFADAVRTLDEAGVTTYFELGPQGVLSALAKECLPAAPSRLFVPALRKDRGEVEALSDALLRLHVHGTTLDWNAFFAPLAGRRIELPTYPFQRQRHWIESRRAPDGDSSRHSLLGTALPVAGSDGILIPGCIPEGELSWLSGHVVAGTSILPGTAFLDIALAAAQQAGAACVVELTIEAPLMLSTSAIELQVSVAAADTMGRRALALYARPPGAAWRRHASGSLGSTVRPSPSVLDSWPPAGAKPVALDGLYAMLAEAGLEYGEPFRRVAGAWRRDAELFVEVRLDEARSHYALHPALLDAALHPFVADSTSTSLELPFCFTGASLYASFATVLRVRIARTEGGFSLEVTDGGGQPVARVESVLLRPVSTKRVEHVHRVAWSELVLPIVRAEGDLLALCGTEISGLAEALRRAGAAYRCFATVGALRAALDAGGPRPTVVAFHDESTDARTITKRGLAFLQEVLADVRLANAQVTFLTHGALAATADDVVSSIAQASLGGLARSARAEHPERVIIHIDLDTDPRSLAALPSVCRSDAAQVALRSGRARVAQFLRAHGSVASKRSLATDGAVLITGGTGSLGSEVARHLVKRHRVRDLVLVSRRGEGAQGATSLRAELELAGARVVMAACDLGDRVKVGQLIASIPRLRGIVHTAGSLDDGLIGTLDPTSIDRAFLPKVDGALHLHELTRDLPLDYFVMFSSVAALLGPPGQASYAAANAVLDALAHHRRAAGLPALAVDFGPWAEVGMAARLGTSWQARLGRLGLIALSTASALAGLDAAQALGEAQLLVAGLGSVPLHKPTGLGGPQDLAELTPAERERSLREWIRAEAARALGLGSPTEVPWERPLRELGMDSLSALELRNALVARLGQPLPATVVFDHPHVAALTRFLAARIAPVPPKSKAVADVIEEMSEGELDALISSLQGKS